MKLLPDYSHHKRKRVALIFAIIFGALCVLFLLLWLLFLRYIAYTDDAYVEGNQVFITPLRPGFITAIHTDDTFLVKKGQLLINLDRTDSIIALNQAEKTGPGRPRGLPELPSGLCLSR